MTLLKRVRQGWQSEVAIGSYSTAKADRHRIIVSAFGETKPLTEWENDSRMAVSPETFIKRLEEGWDGEAAMSTVEANERIKTRSPQKLYFGKSLPQWLRDPRCQVSRATLVRNFEMDMEPEKALQFRMHPRGDENSLRTQSPEHALELLEQGGEIWHYQEKDRSRISLILGEHRYEIEDDLLESLADKGQIGENFSSPGIKMYRLSGPTLR